jgi:hypothetical protein
MPECGFGVGSFVANFLAVKPQVKAGIGHLISGLQIRGMRVRAASRFDLWRAGACRDAPRRHKPVRDAPQRAVVRLSRRVTPCHPVLDRVVYGGIGLAEPAVARIRFRIERYFL